MNVCAINGISCARQLWRPCLPDSSGSTCKQQELERVLSGPGGQKLLKKPHTEPHTLAPVPLFLTEPTQLRAHRPDRWSCATRLSGKTRSLLLLLEQEGGSYTVDLKRDTVLC